MMLFIIMVILMGLLQCVIVFIVTAYLKRFAQLFT